MNASAQRKPRIKLRSDEGKFERAPIVVEGEVIEMKDALPEIVRRYAAGESMRDIAPDYNVDRATLYRWMLAGVGDKQYADIVTSCLVRRVQEADEMLRSAREPCDVARAREIARFARMDLERRRPQLYGPKQEIAAVAVPQLLVLTRME